MTKFLAAIYKENSTDSLSLMNGVQNKSKVSITPRGKLITVGVVCRNVLDSWVVSPNLVVSVKKRNK